MAAARCAACVWRTTWPATRCALVAEPVAALAQHWVMRASLQTVGLATGGMLPAALVAACALQTLFMLPQPFCM